VLNFVARELFEKFSLRRLAVFLKWSKLPLNRHFLAFKFLKASLKELSAIYRINAERVKPVCFMPENLTNEFVL